MRLLFVLLALAGCARETCPIAAGAGEPQLLIVNARGEAPVLAIAGARVVYAGGSLPPDACAGWSAAPRLDAAGGLVLPAFHDSHVHLLSGGLAAGEVNLSDAETVAEAVERVRAFADANPAKAWVIGRGWGYGLVPKGTFPTRAQLDAVVADRPVLLESYDGHTAWANSEALRRAGVTDQTPDPADGTIVREADGRTPQGALLEGAMGLVPVPEPTRGEKAAALELALAHCAALGIASMDAIEADAEVLELLAELDAAGKLALRVRLGLPLEGDLAGYRALRERIGGAGRLRFEFVKGFVDGVVESRTALMLEPYEGTTVRGQPLIPDLFERVAAAQAAGFGVALHAIGDGAVRLSLDAFAQSGPGPARRIEHIEVIHPDDLGRFAAVGVTASMQPFHANPFGDTPDEGPWSENLGAERRRRTFAWRQLLDAGAPLVFGSDWPVFSADPLWGLAVALTRQDEHGLPAGGWNAHQTVTLPEALRAYWAGRPADTQRPPAAGLAPVVGEVADLVVLAPEVDLERPASLWTGSVRFTVVAGAVVTPAYH